MKKICIFCEEWEKKEKVLFETEDFFVIFSIHPVTKGHLLIISKKHKETIFELKESEWKDFSLALQKVKVYLDERFSPQGYNIGANFGGAAGQSVMHAHVHVISRHNANGEDVELEREYRI